MSNVCLGKCEDSNARATVHAELRLGLRTDPLLSTHRTWREGQRKTSLVGQARRRVPVL